MTIQDLTIAGTVACRVPKNVNEEEKSGDIRYPAFVSAAIGLAGGTTAFENVTVNTKYLLQRKLMQKSSRLAGRLPGKM